MLNRRDFLIHLEPVKQWINDYFENIESYPVKSQSLPGNIISKLPQSAPENPTSIDEILEDLSSIILPGITHWQHPNFHAYFPANSSMESLFAEFITASIGAQCMIWETSPAAAELEERMMQWLAKLMGIPESWEGVIQDTASTATLTAILTAREVSTDFISNRKGVPSGLRVYASSETHSSIEKAVGIAGIGRDNYVRIEVDESQAMLPDALERAIVNDLKHGLRPCCVVATLGTTGTVAMDPLLDIARICQRYNVWLHVDAAYAGSALILPEMHHFMEGIELADSFVFNPHKWLFTNFDCSVYWVKDVDALISTFEVLPEYLRTSTRGQVNDYRDWGVPLGRRFRALKLWFVLRGFGVKGLQEKLRAQITMTKEFGQRLGEVDVLEVTSGPFLNFCSFSVNVSDDNSTNDLLTEQLMTKMNARGKVFVSHTKIHSRYVIRMVFGQTNLEQRHVDLALAEIKTVATQVCKSADI